MFFTRNAPITDNRTTLPEKWASMVQGFVVILHSKSNVNNMDQPTPKKTYRLKKTKVEESVVNAYKRMEERIVASYRAIENSVVGTYKKIEDDFVEHFLEKVDDENENENSDSKP